jgi:nitrite reductase (NAD(P)H)
MVLSQDERRPQTEVIKERGQERPADWPKESLPAKLHESAIVTPKSEWEWRNLATVHDLTPNTDATTWVPAVLNPLFHLIFSARSAAVKYGDSQLAIFHIPRRGYFATQQVRFISLLC